MGWVLPISPGKTKENFFLRAYIPKTLIKSVCTYSVDCQWLLESIRTLLLSWSIAFWVNPYPFEKKGVDQLKTSLTVHTVCFCFKLELFQKVLSVYLTFYSDLIMGLFELWLSGEILFFFWLMDTTIFITWGLIWVEIKLKKIQLRCGYIELPYSRHHNQRFIFFQPIFWRPFLCLQGNFSLKNLILT